MFNTNISSLVLNINKSAMKTAVMTSNQSQYPYAKAVFSRGLEGFSTISSSLSPSVEESVKQELMGIHKSMSTELLIFDKKKMDAVLAQVEKWSESLVEKIHSIKL